MDRLEQKLAEVDWKLFEKHIISLVQNGVKAVQSTITDGATGLISQVSIWTDVCAATSAINFETKEHAHNSNNLHAQWLRTHAFNDEADAVSKSFKALNPADFIYKRVAECHHPELEVLNDLLTNDVQVKIADSYVSDQLKQVREEIIAAGLLHGLPHESTVWFGISSEKDWYDHEIGVIL